jgi:uncharacterized SAM-binding protein YcdF (DUF218 family)
MGLITHLIPLQLKVAAHLVGQPEIILVLGGESTRERFAAELAQIDPTLEVWVSSGLLPGDALPIFRAAAISDSRVRLDYQATDTVTNFTTLLPKLKQRQIRHLYLVTSDYHMPRANAIAAIVLGSQGIAFTSVAVPTIYMREARLKAIRDQGRAILWRFTGYTGARLKQDLAGVPGFSRLV